LNRFSKPARTTRRAVNTLKIPEASVNGETFFGIHWLYFAIAMPRKGNQFDKEINFAGRLM